MERSREWTSVPETGNSAENFMMGILAEELYNLPTAEYANRRGFAFRQLTVYHAAFQACADLKNVEVLFFLIFFIFNLTASPVSNLQFSYVFSNMVSSFFFW